MQNPKDGTHEAFAAPREQQCCKKLDLKTASNHVNGTLGGIDEAPDYFHQQLIREMSVRFEPDWDDPHIHYALAVMARYCNMPLG